jgi:hypothetical protein
MGWGLRGKTQRTLEHTVGAVVPGSEFVFIAFQAMRGHKRNFGVYPSLIRPKTFNEKVLHRMVFDRRPILIQLQDKYAARDYVREKLGEHILPRLYWLTKTPADIPFDDLPSRFVVKANHGSGWIRLVPDKTTLNRHELIDACNSWLRWNYYWPSREWAYRTIEPRVMVEKFISDGTVPAPTDYKFYVFGGRAHMIQVDAGRFGPHHRREFYRTSWDRLNVATQSRTSELLPRPPHLHEMVECAEKLANGLDFLRVDLYDAGQVYFGEMTIYPYAGGAEFIPDAWNQYLGGLRDLSFGRTGARGQ